MSDQGREIGEAGQSKYQHSFQMSHHKERGKERQRDEGKEGDEE